MPRLFGPLLPHMLLPGGSPNLLGALLTLRQNPSGGSGQIVGTPWAGAMGITETIGQIMARSALSVPSPGPEEMPEREYPDRSQLPQAPASPAVALWPEPPFGNPLPHPGRHRQDPQTVGVSFLASRLLEAGQKPPDTQGAVGPTQILVGLNGRVKLFDKAGTPGALNTTLDNFFDSVRGGLSTSDPRVRFDRTANRWFVSAINIGFFGSNSVLLAVSDGPTISAATSFTFFQFVTDGVGAVPNADSGGFADYPTLAVDASAVYIGVNVFLNNSFASTTGFVVRKSSLLTNGPIVVTPFRQMGLLRGNGLHTPQGADNDDIAAGEGYFIGTHISSRGQLVLRRVTDPGGTPILSDNIPLTVPQTSIPTTIPVLGSNQPLDALDDRLMSAQIHKNRLSGDTSLWTAHTINVNETGVPGSANLRAGIRWYQIGNLFAGTPPQLTQAGTLFSDSLDSPANYWMGTIAMSGQGHAAIGASVGGANQRAEIAVAGRLVGDTPGLTQLPIVAQTTTFTYNAQNEIQRWGDYSQTCVDPTDDMTFWTFQEYCLNTNSWGVRVLQLKAPPPATILTLAPDTIPTGATTSVVVTGKSVGGSAFFDPDSSYLRHLTASIGGSGVTVDAMTFQGPTQITLVLRVDAGADVGMRDLTIVNPDGQQVTKTGVLKIVNNSTVTVSGTVTLEGIVDYASPQNLTFEFRPANGGAVFLRSVAVGPGGAYSLANITPGVYNLAIKGSKWLRRVVAADLSVSRSGVDAQLLPGDINDDNVIDLDDLMLFFDAYGSAAGEENWNPNADLTCDDIIDLEDLSLFFENYGSDGDP